jgi:hypothetical protein
MYAPSPTTAWRCLVAGFMLASVRLASSAIAAEESAAATPAATVKAGSDLHVRYAEARLALAKLDLEKARQQNADAGSPQVPAADMLRLEVRVDALQQVVDAEAARRNGPNVTGQVARARAALLLARDDLARLERLRAASPVAVPEIDLQRQRARVQIAELRMAMWEDPDHIPSALDRMQIQIDQLTDQIVDLLDQIENRRLVTPPP